MHRGPCCGYPPLTPILYDDPAAHPYALVADKEGVLDPGKGEVNLNAAPWLGLVRLQVEPVTVGIQTNIGAWETRALQG
jgi:hypothetical protein